MARKVSDFFSHEEEPGYFTYNQDGWFDWRKGEKTACLDGHFTPEELRGIANEIERRNKK